MDKILGRIGELVQRLLHLDRIGHVDISSGYVKHRIPKGTRPAMFAFGHLDLFTGNLQAPVAFMQHLQRLLQAQFQRPLLRDCRQAGEPQSQQAETGYAPNDRVSFIQHGHRLVVRPDPIARIAPFPLRKEKPRLTKGAGASGNCPPVSSRRLYTLRRSAYWCLCRRKIRNPG